MSCDWNITIRKEHHGRIMLRIEDMEVEGARFGGQFKKVLQSFEKCLDYSGTNVCIDTECISPNI